MSRFLKSNTDLQRGFTLVELVTVMVIAGVLAAVLAPRFFDNNIFQSRGFADQVQATLRYAQKTAIAQRRFVCVAFTSGSIALTIGSTNACGTPLVPPSGGASYSIAAPSNIAFSPTPTDFYFDATGKPSIGTSVVIGATAITVEAETGYVHQ